MTGDENEGYQSSKLKLKNCYSVNRKLVFNKILLRNNISLFIYTSGIISINCSAHCLVVGVNKSP